MRRKARSTVNRAKPHLAPFDTIYAFDMFVRFLNIRTALGMNKSQSIRDIVAKEFSYLEWNVLLKNIDLLKRLSERKVTANPKVPSSSDGRFSNNQEEQRSRDVRPSVNWPNKYLSFLELRFGHSIIAGQKNGLRQWFARYEIDKGNPTAVMADTYAVAICRLAILRLRRI
jgi:hypothetical protein